MYGIVEISGHQYQVKAGDLIDVAKLKVDEGTELQIDRVLFIGGEKALVGAPTVAGAQVTAKVLKHAKSRKIVVFKRRPGAWRKKKGHRTEYTALLITEVNDGQGNSCKVDTDSKNAKK